MRQKERKEGIVSKAKKNKCHYNLSELVSNGLHDTLCPLDKETNQMYRRIIPNMEVRETFLPWF